MICRILDTEIAFNRRALFSCDVGRAKMSKRLINLRSVIRTRRLTPPNETLAFGGVARPSFGSTNNPAHDCRPILRNSALLSRAT
jgi:hypothetical protein